MAITTGPCEPWTDGDSVAACCPVDIGTDDPELVFGPSIDAASELLFELSGRQFPGLCSQVVRPCVTDSCWGDLFAPAQVPAVPWAYGAWGWGWGWGYDGSGGARCSCKHISRALLQGFPVQEITEVEISGVVIDSSEYRLDEYRWLTRLADVNGNPQFWPSCQNLARDLGEPGTWSVEYTFGQEVPALGVLAANQLACEVYRSCQGSGSDGAACNLPVGVTSITRQGVTIERAPFVAWGMVNSNGAFTWATGLTFVDMFLSAYNPFGQRGRGAVWSPDIEQYGMITPQGSP